MRTVSHREMRNSSGEILRAVANGETVQVTNNGQVAAIISPPSGDPMADLVARGQVRPARSSLAQLSSVPRRRSATASSEIVADTRGTW